MKKRKTLEKYTLIFIGTIIIYIAFLLLTSLIPSSWLKTNVTKSSETLKQLGKEGDCLQYDLGYKNEQLFIFTDALMINTAYSIDNKHPIESMLLARKSYIPGQTEIVYEEGNHVKSPKQYMDGSNTYQTKELYGLMHDDGNKEGFEYPRYWHGYLVVLRPLLCLFDYTGLRILSCTIFILLTIIFLILIGKKINFISALLYLLAFLSFHIYLVSFSLNEITTFYLAIITSIIILLLDKKIEKYAGIVFFIIGSLTSFVDLLTTPIVSLAIPLTIYFLLKQKEDVEIKKQMIDFLKLCILWGIGYSLTWIMKWILVDLILGRDIVPEAINQIIFRTQNNTIKMLNLKQYILIHIILLAKEMNINILIVNLLINVTLTIIGLIKNRKNKIQYKDIIPYIIIAVFPITWFMLVNQHSIAHIFFTYRIYIIMILGIQIVLAKLAGYYTKKGEKIER